MKEIIFKQTNYNKIRSELNTVQGRCSARTITISEMECGFNQVERKLNIPKKYMDGVKVNIDYYADNFSGSYKFIPESTHFCAYYKNGSWRITNIGRYPTRRASKRFVVTLTEIAKEKILENHEVW